MFNAVKSSASMVVVGVRNVPSGLPAGSGIAAYQSPVRMVLRASSPSKVRKGLE